MSPVERAVKKDPITFSDLMRARFKGVIEPVAASFNRMGLYPNTITLLGLFGTALGAYALARGHITAGGLILLVMAPFDALDGTMARLRGMSSSFGAFVDSVSDRYAELLIFGGLLIYFLQQGDLLGVGLSYAAAAGSLMVSYIRARAQSLGMETKVGIFSRLERLMVLIPCLIFNQPILALGLIALFANITALQRILHVRAQAYEQPGIHREK